MRIAYVGVKWRSRGRETVGGVPPVGVGDRMLSYLTGSAEGGV